MKQAFLYSLKKSLPVLVSFIPVGLAYGILMQTSGYNWIWTAGTCVSVFAGSLQFLMVRFFAGGVSLASAAIIPQLIACAVTVGLHLWKRNSFLSIFGGTAVCMLLTQLVF